MEAWPLPIGNAAKLFVNPPAGVERWRLRRSIADLTGPSDGVLIYDGKDRMMWDLSIPESGTYRYGVWYTRDDGATWVEPEFATLDASPDYASQGADAQTVVRDRLFLGLQHEVAAGRLRPPRGKTAIPVFTAPPAFDVGNFPCLSVHLDSDGPAERGVGEDFPDTDIEDAWLEDEGWIARHELTVIGWVLNADERIDLRQAIKRLVVGNLPIFEATGLLQVEFSQQDDEDFNSYSAPVYLARGRFTCLAPYGVSTQVDPIREVDVIANP
ncbi:MAG: hypothetical protein EOM91_18740 [Sphingobacteriia bacterium]|nr:hypothetical protein [Sphingobacteriia bacterium]